MLEFSEYVMVLESEPVVFPLVLPVFVVVHFFDARNQRVVFLSVESFEEVLLFFGPVVYIVMLLL